MHMYYNCSYYRAAAAVILIVVSLLFGCGSSPPSKQTLDDFLHSRYAIAQNRLTNENRKLTSDEFTVLCAILKTAKPASETAGEGHGFLAQIEGGMYGYGDDSEVTVLCLCAPHYIYCGGSLHVISERRYSQALRLAAGVGPGDNVIGDD